MPCTNLFEFSAKARGIPKRQKPPDESGGFLIATGLQPGLDGFLAI
jgi:hypothetical protein